MGQRNIIIVGAGAAGLMAAGRAAQEGGAALVLEKMAQPGRKLGITGKGRCNLTNRAELPRFIEHFGPGGKFLHPAFARFFSDELIAFFESQGLALVTERGGRVFPACAKAPSVVRALVRWVKKCGVQIRPETPAESLMIEEGRVVGVLAGGRAWPCEAVILATGGASYPATGSTGDGYRLAQAAGHTLAPIRPALVPLETAGTGALAGLDLRNVQVQLRIDGKKRREAFGEMSFTDFGVSGPVILSLSGQAVEALEQGRRVTLALDLKPALDEPKLDARLRKDFSARGREPLRVILRGLLPAALIPLCLGQTGLSPLAAGNQVSADERRRLRGWLKDFRIEVRGHRPLSEAIITAGGIPTREVDPRTMQSRITKGLFFAGEILDVQADTGGYNLQAAFSTGWLAGTCAARDSGHVL